MCKSWLQTGTRAQPSFKQRLNDIVDTQQRQVGQYLQRPLTLHFTVEVVNRQKRTRTTPRQLAYASIRLWRHTRPSYRIITRSCWCHTHTHSKPSRELRYELVLREEWAYDKAYLTAQSYQLVPYLSRVVRTITALDRSITTSIKGESTPSVFLTQVQTTLAEKQDIGDWLLYLQCR